MSLISCLRPPFCNVILPVQAEKIYSLFLRCPTPVSFPRMKYLRTLEKIKDREFCRNLRYADFAGRSSSRLFDEENNVIVMALIAECSAIESTD